MSIYNSSQKRLDIQCPSLQRNRGQEGHHQVVCVCVEKYFSLTKITDAKDKFNAMPCFLSIKDPLQVLWTDSWKAIALVKTNLGTRQWLLIGNSLDIAFC